jgi:hypothetical protein
VWAADIIGQRVDFDRLSAARAADGIVEVPFFADPRGDVHGTKMFFRGIPEAKGRRDVITSLETLK